MSSSGIHRLFHEVGVSNNQCKFLFSTADGESMLRRMKVSDIRVFRLVNISLNQDANIKNKIKTSFVESRFQLVKKI